MPRTGVYTSTEERQRLRQSYYATSEKEAGLTHLWHLQRLAEIRFNPSHTIQDVPEVDFQSTGGPFDVYRDLFAQRTAQQVQYEEARIYEQNKALYRSIVLAADDAARRARHMNLVPTDDQVKRFDNIQQQTLHRTQDRERRQRIVAEENKKLLGHLISVPPHVRPTKELDAWYHNVHKKRLAQLSRFKPAEQYAGARLLEGTAAYAALSRGSSGARGGGYKAAAPPLVRGQPYPSPPAVESVNGGPLSDCEDASMTSTRRPRRPEWKPIAATDIPLLHHDADQQLRSGRRRSRSGGGGGVAMTSVNSASERGRTVSSAHVRHDSTPRSSSPVQRELLPAAPAPTSMERIEMVNALYRGGPNAGSTTRKTHGVRRVTAEEEGGVTQLWRRAVQDRYSHYSESSKSTNAKSNSARAASADEMPEAATWDGRARGEENASMPSARPVLKQHHEQKQQKWVSPTNMGIDGSRQQRRLSKAPPAISARPPLAAVPTSTPPAKQLSFQETECTASTDDKDEAAALKELMEGWSRRSGGGDAAYVPV
jgi:hypothetical protein